MAVGPANRIADILEKSESTQRVLDEATEGFSLQLVQEAEDGEEVLSIDRITADSSPIIRLVDAILFNAIQRRASDIHVEPFEDRVVRFARNLELRIPGVEEEVGTSRVVVECLEQGAGLILTDRISAEMLSARRTGSGRRQSYRFPPLVRMSNTFLTEGEDSVEEIIRAFGRIDQSRAAAARLLGLGYKAFLYRLEKHGMAGNGTEDVAESPEMGS